MITKPNFAQGSPKRLIVNRVLHGEIVNSM